MHHRLERVLPYQPDQLFKLVGEVEAYPRFIPWIVRLRTWNRRHGGEGVTLFDAEAEVRFSIVHERFATRVRLDAPRQTIDVDLIAGPFRRLKNKWVFRPHPDGCALVFEIDFEFKSRLLRTLLAANFHRATTKLVDCFEARAKELYGAQP